MIQNKYELRGEDHGTLDTKKTATDIAQEKYANLSPKEALFLATKDLQDEIESKQEAQHKLERNDKNILKNEIEEGLKNYFTEKNELSKMKLTKRYAIHVTAPKNSRSIRIPLSR